MKARVLLIPDLDFSATHPSAQDQNTKGKWVKTGASSYELISDFSFFNIFSFQAISDPQSNIDATATVTIESSNFDFFKSAENNYTGVDRDYAYDYFAPYADSSGQNIELIVTTTPTATMYGQGEVYPYKHIKIKVSSAATTGKLQIEFTQK